MEKKRDLLSPLTDLVNALMTLHHDAAKLELVDNDSASRRLKLGLCNIENKELKAFKRAVLDTRKEINSLPPRSYVKSTTKHLKHQK